MFAPYVGKFFTRAILFGNFILLFDDFHCWFYCGRSEECVDRICDFAVDFFEDDSCGIFWDGCVSRAYMDVEKIFYRVGNGIDGVRFCFAFCDIVSIDDI